MADQMILDLNTKVAKLNALFESLDQDIKKIKISLVSKATRRPPATACKISYDSEGHVLNGSKMEIEDLPDDIPISKLKNLKKILESKLESGDLKELRNMIAESVKIKITHASTGVKINYNEYGQVTSSSDLILEDIPDLPVSKITGLEEMIQLLEAGSSQDNTKTDDYSITPGTFTKVTFDSRGRIVSGIDMGMNDLPIELISSVNSMQSKLVNMVHQDSFKNLIKVVDSKLESNKSITPGEFTKVKVDSKGLVIQGDHLSLRDLPEINIKDIPDLASSLRDKAYQKDLVSLMQTVSSLSNRTTLDISSLHKECGDKVGIVEFSELKKSVESINSNLNSISLRLPSEHLSSEIRSIREAVDTLSGRISTIEQKLQK